MVQKRGRRTCVFVRALPGTLYDTSQQRFNNGISIPPWDCRQIVPTSWASLDAHNSLDRHKLIRGCEFDTPSTSNWSPKYDGSAELRSF